MSVQILNLLVHAGHLQHLMAAGTVIQVDRGRDWAGRGTIFARCPSSRAASYFSPCYRRVLRWRQLPQNLSALEKVSQREIYRPIHRARRSSTRLKRAVVSLRVIFDFQLIPATFPAQASTRFASANDFL